MKILKKINNKIIKLLIVIILIVLSIFPLYTIITNTDYLGKLLFADFLYEDTYMGASVLDLKYWNPLTVIVKDTPCAAGDLCRTLIYDNNTISNHNFFADNIDTKTFKIIGSCAIEMHDHVCYAKDKDNYYKITNTFHEIGVVGYENVTKIEKEDISSFTDYYDYGNGYYSEDWSLYYNEEMLFGANIENFEPLSEAISGCSQSLIYIDSYYSYYKGKHLNGGDKETISCKEEGIFTKFKHYYKDNQSVYFKGELMFDRGSEPNVQPNIDFTFSTLELLDGNLGENYISKSQYNYKDEYVEVQRDYLFCGSKYLGEGDNIKEVVQQVEYDLELIPNHYANYTDSQLFICDKGKYTELENINPIWTSVDSEGEFYFLLYPN